MTTLHYTTLDELLDRHIGTKETPERQLFDSEVRTSVEAWRLGESLKNTREKENLTQEQLEEKSGVKKSQISRMENGHSVSLSTWSKVFRALGYESGTLDLGTRRIVLW